MSSRPIRVAILWTSLSGYMNACLRELARAPDVDLLVCDAGPDAAAPYDEAAFAWMPARLSYTAEPNLRELRHALDDFRPTALIVGAWGNKTYKTLLREWSSASRIVLMDNQWRGNIKQRTAIALSGIVIRPFYDWAFVAGERQAQFARRLGFCESGIIPGALVCDFDAFARAARPQAGATARFIYVGRASPEKGVHVLLAAYAQYREQSLSPWPLHLVGASHRSEEPGVSALGFVQPNELPAVLGEGGTFVLPSLFEPWGVVLHEAAAAGLPLIATDVCGATPHLLRTGLNGMSVGAGRKEELTRALLEMERLGPDDRAQMGAASRRLASAYTPSTWSAAVRWMVSRKA